jgi:hypothetical protein
VAKIWEAYVEWNSLKTQAVGLLCLMFDLRNYDVGEMAVLEETNVDPAMNFTEYQWIYS